MAEKKTKKKKNPNVGILNNPLAQQYMASRSGQTIQGILPSLEQGGLGGFLRDVIRPFADLSAFGGEMVSLPGDLARRQLLTRNTEQRQGQRSDVAQMLGGGLMNTMQSPDMSMQEALGGGGDFRQAQQLLEERDSLLNSLEGRYNGTDGSLSPRYMTRQKFEDLQADPLTEGSKYAATALSLAPLGLGGGIPAMALEGAISGGLGGYGAADRGQEMEGLTQGALFGGAAGGVLGGLGKAFGKGGDDISRAARQGDGSIDDILARFERGGLENLTPKEGRLIPARQRYEIAGIDGLYPGEIRGIPTQAKAIGIEPLKGQDIGDVTKLYLDFEDVTKDYGIKKNKVGVTQLGQRSDKAIGELARSSTKVTDRQSLVELAAQRLAEEKDISLEAARSAIDTQINRTLKDGSKLTQLSDEQIAKLKFTGDKDAFTLRSGNVSTLSKERYANALLSEEADGILRTNIPEIAKPLSDKSLYHRVRDQITRKKAEGVNVPFSLFRLPGFGLPEKARMGVGSVQRGGGLFGGGLSGATGGLRGLIGDVASNPMVQYAVPRAGYAMPTSEGTVHPAQMMDQMMQDQAMAQGGMAGIGDMGMGGMDTGMGMMGIQQPQQSSPQEVAQMVWQMYNSGMKPSDIKTMLTMTGVLNGSANGKPLPATQIETLSATRSSLQGLGELEQLIKQNSSRFGVIQGGILGDISMSLGLDPERAYIQSKINTLAQTVGRALEGGVLREGDIARYRAMLPQLTDTPEAALQKLRSTIENIKASYGNLQQDFARAGYSVDGAAAPTMEDYVMQQY